MPSPSHSLASPETLSQKLPGTTRSRVCGLPSQLRVKGEKMTHDGLNQRRLLGPQDGVQAHGWALFGLPPAPHSVAKLSILKNQEIACKQMYDFWLLLKNQKGRLFWAHIPRQQTAALGSQRPPLDRTSIPYLATDSPLPFCAPATEVCVSRLVPGFLHLPCVSHPHTLALGFAAGATPTGQLRGVILMDSNIKSYGTGPYSCPLCYPRKHQLLHSF